MLLLVLRSNEVPGEGDPEKSGSKKSVVERKESGQLKCFKSCIDFPKKTSKTGDRLTSHFGSSKQRGACFISLGEKEAHLILTIRNIIVPRYLRYSQGEIKCNPRWFENLKCL